jgi:hypothetical protein
MDGTRPTLTTPWMGFRIREHQRPVHQAVGCRSITMWCGSTEVDVCGGDAGATTGHHGDRDDGGVGQRLRATMRSVSALEGILSSIALRSLSVLLAEGS